MNKKFAQLTLNDLLEKLSDYTLQYSKMHLNGGEDRDFYQVRREILELQQEIVRRKEVEDDDIYRESDDATDDSDRYYPGNRSASD